jgi:hypothetical protein
VNFGTARILVIVGLVVAGVAILVNGFGHGATSVGATTGGTVTQSQSPSAASPTTSASPTQSTLPSPQAPADVTVAVFNGTSSAGLAAQAQQSLTQAGYVADPKSPQNSPVAGVSKTTVYYRGGADAAQNKSDAKSIADQFFSGAKVQLLGSDYDSLISADTPVAIVLGQDYATANSTGG